MELASAYYLIIATHKSKQDKLSQQQLGLSACKGFQGLGLVFLTASETYANPPEGFWFLCYRLLAASEEFGLLDHKIKIENAIYSGAVLFKKLVIFHAIDKNKLSPREMSAVFDGLIRGINYVQSYMESLTDVHLKSGTEIFGFSLDKDQPPFIQNNISAATAKLLRYVDKVEIDKIIQFLLYEAQKDPQRANFVNHEVFSRILVSLKYKKDKKQHRRINKKYNCHAIIGLDDLVEFLLEKESKKHFASKGTADISNDDDFEGFQMLLDWDSEAKSVEKNLVIDKLEIIDSSINGYAIVWNNAGSGKLQVGDAVGIVPDFNSTAKKIEIGLIRRIDATSENILFGVELIGLESTLIHIARDNFDTGDWALFLFGSPNYDVGILCHKVQHYQTGEAVFVRQAEKKMPCSLGVILNSTPLLDHIALSY